MLKTRVCAVDEVDETFQTFQVPGVKRPILVFRVDDSIVAGSSICPHEDVSLAKGCLKNGDLVCRAHGYAFDLKDGLCRHDKTLRWHRYPVSIKGGDVYVDLLPRFESG